VIRFFQITFLLVLLGFPLVQQWTPLEILKLKVFDSLVEEKSVSNYFSIINITEEDIAKEGGYPFSRQTLAEIQIELLKKGAIGVGWVMAFPQPDRFGGDEQFADALGYAPSVLAMFENDNGDYPETTGTVILGEDIGGYEAKGVIENIDILKNNAAQGIAIAPTDVDQLVRRMPLLMRTPDGWVSAYGTEVLKVLANADTYVIKTNPNGIEEVRVRGIPPVPTDSLGRKWISWVDTPQFSLSEIRTLCQGLCAVNNIEGRFVFIGVTAKGIMPQVATPVGLLEPHKIQAALSESILIQDSPKIPDWSIAAEILIFTFTVLAVWLLLSYLGITWGIGLGSVIWLSTAFGGVYLIKSGILLDVSWSLVSQFVVGSVAFYLRFREQYKLRLQIKKQFEHYLDPRQVKELQNNPDKLKLGGEKRYCTFLFTDVRGFTAMSEKLPPEEVTYIMNEALTVQQEAVQKHGGMVDKYIGDAMMAIFNAPLDIEDQEDRAIQTAIEIIDGIEKLDCGVKVGVGINSGEAVVGNMGSKTRFDYTAIGDPVNTAARLESATKEVGEDILIGDTTKKSCKFELKLLDPIKVKGKQKALQIYTVKNGN
jgi:adenylate cyclase